MIVCRKLMRKKSRIKMNLLKNKSKKLMRYLKRLVHVLVYLKKKKNIMNLNMKIN